MPNTSKKKAPAGPSLNPFSHGPRMVGGGRGAGPFAQFMNAVSKLVAMARDRDRLKRYAALVWGDAPWLLLGAISIVAVSLSWTVNLYRSELDPKVALALASPVPLFVLLASLRLRRRLKPAKEKLEDDTGDEAAALFDAALATLLPYLLTVVVFDVVLRFTGSRPESVLEWLQSFMLFSMTEGIVSGPIEALSWALMWAALLLSVFAFHRSWFSGVFGLFGYSFSLALSIFLTKLFVIDIGLTRMFVGLVLDILPLPDFAVDVPVWVERFAFRAALVFLELGVAGAVWTTSRAHFVVAGEKESHQERAQGRQQRRPPRSGSAW